MNRLLTPETGVHAGALGTYVAAATGHLATIGGDTVLWIPIVIQVLSFLAQLFNNSKKKPQAPPAETPPAQP